MTRLVMLAVLWTCCLALPVAAGSPSVPYPSESDASNSGLGVCPGFGEWHGWGNRCEVCQPWEWLACLQQSLWPPSGFRHSSTHGRATGQGEPLGGTSWLNRPYHVGWFAGTMWGSDVRKNQIGQHNTFFGGYQIGVDFDHYWGTQLRLGLASPELQNQTQTQFHRSARVTLFDVDLLYYPWGDSRIRPYFLFGIGTGRFDFRDEFGSRQADTMLALPFGIGVKHHFRRWLSLRIEAVDNLAFAGGHASTMHNLSLTAGVEVHLGARQKSYWPWNPSRHLW